MAHARRLQVSTGVLGMVLLSSSAGVAQERVVRGQVLDGTRDLGVANARVATWPTGTTTLTDSDGHFRIDVSGAVLDSIVVRRPGYATQSLTGASIDVDRPLIVRLQPAPFVMDPVRVGLSFGERMDAAEEFLADRLDRLSGTWRVASGQDLQRHESTHDSDPWRMIHDELGAGWAGAASIRVGPREIQPEVYLDENRVWFWQFREVRPASLCRVEVYVPPRKVIRLDELDIEPQIRAYTCSFMARVAEGEVELSRYVRGRLHASGGG